MTEDDSRFPFVSCLSRIAHCMLRKLAQKTKQKQEKYLDSSYKHTAIKKKTEKIIKTSKNCKIYHIIRATALKPFFH